MRFAVLSALSFFLSAAANAAPWGDISGRDHAFAALLSSDSDLDVRLGAISLYRSDTNSPDNLDLAAEIAWSACSGKRELNPDALAWLAKALGNTGQARYAALLDYCLSRPINEKTKKHVALVRQQLTGDALNSFEGGKMNLQQIRDLLTTKRNRIAPDLLNASFGELQRNQTVDEIYAKLGRPDSIGRINVPRGKAGHLFVKVRITQDVLALGYSDVGTIRFSLNDEGSEWLLHDAESVRELYWLGREGRFASIIELLAMGDGPELRDVARHVIRKGHIDREILDGAANRIHASRLENDKVLGDGLAWLCRIIQRSGDGRYKPLLLEISETARSEKLRKYAATAAAALPEAEARFVPPGQ